MKIATPSPENSHAPLSQQPPSKGGGPVKPPFLKIWLEAQPPPAESGGAHYINVIFSKASSIFLLSKYFVNIIFY